MISGQVCLRRGETLAAGCCWIYDNEIDWADDTCEDGGLVEVLDGVLERDLIVLKAGAFVRDGDHVRPIQPAPVTN